MKPSWPLRRKWFWGASRRSRRKSVSEGMAVGLSQAGGGAAARTEEVAAPEINRRLHRKVAIGAF
jgi:hypothetical protein